MQRKEIINVTNAPNICANRYRQSENAVANYGHSAQANLIWGTLVHKRRK